MTRRHVLLLFSLLAASGCADIEPSRILHPGPAWYQQDQAQKFDPYPATDIGPEVAGGRPLAYMRPAPENERVQNATTYMERYRQMPPPGLYRPPREPALQQAIPYGAPGALPVAPPAPAMEIAPPFTP